MIRRTRWRTVTSGEVGTTVERLTRTITDGGGTDRDGRVRHMYLLSVLESSGPSALRVVSRDDAWAIAAVFPGRLLVPAGDPTLLRDARSRRARERERWLCLRCDSSSTWQVVYSSYAAR